MAAHPAGPAGPLGPSNEDPVAAARAWLLRNGATPPDLTTATVATSAGEPRPAAEGESRTSRASTAGETGRSRGSTGTATDGRAGQRRRRRTSESSRDPEVEPGGDGDGDPDADPETVARTIVIRKLAAQARTRAELAKALAARDVPQQVAGDVLDRMEAVGLVDDAAYARDWVQSRQQRRHLSASALRRELQAKGVDRDQIDEAVATVETDDEVRAARSLAEKKLASMSGLGRDVQYRRLAGALARRGFGGAVAAGVLNDVLGHAGDTDA